MTVNYGDFGLVWVVAALLSPREPKEAVARCEIPVW
jgi:hypothetical protein